MDKLKMHTKDFVDQNIEKIAELFPNCVTESADYAEKRRLEENNKQRESADKSLRMKIDWDLLKQELSDHIVEGPQERYHLNWPGKRDALLAANTPITKTLRPCRKESVDFDTTENLFIEGDNLDALKLLQETYLGKVKMIYIDPPYNTGKDFIYRDNFKVDSNQWLVDSGQKDVEGNRLVANTDSNGRFHSDWLSMMYPRLKLARNLLSDDGVIVTHIDENEYSNLEKLLNEVFGEQNNLGTVVWDKRNPKGDATGIAQQHELISFYCKNREHFKQKVDFKRPKENAETMLNKFGQFVSANGGVNDTVRTKYKEWLKKQNFSGGDEAYCFIDDDGDIYRPVSMAWPNKKKAPDNYFIPLIHPVTKKECPIPERGWRNPLETMEQLQKDGLILFGVDETTQPNRKYLLKENLYENISSLIYYGGSDDALLSELGVWFDTPKVVNVSKKLILPICKENDIILDFFAGSATTAHAVMQLNAEELAQENNQRKSAQSADKPAGKRKFIMVQLPEPCDEKSEAFKAGYKTIAEIGKERIRRAGKKISADYAEKRRLEEEKKKGDLFSEADSKNNQRKSAQSADKPDVGFRVLKVDSSNMADVYYKPDAVEQNQLKLLTDNIKDNRTSEDLLFQVLLDWGVDLTLPITREFIRPQMTQMDADEKNKENNQRKSTDSLEVFFVDGNALAACFETNGKITEDFCKELAKCQPLRVVFRDAGFRDDSAKINVEQIFKLMSPHTDVKTI